MREKDVESHIKDYVRQQGGWVVKLHADGTQGMNTLDLLGSLNGKPFLVEVKKPNGRVRPHQTYLVERASTTGYVSGIVSSLKEFKALWQI